METLELTKLTEEEIAKFPETPQDDEEVFRTLRWEPHNEKSGRCLAEAQIVSDGRYLYTISRQIPTKKQVDEREEDEDTVKTQLVCEIYDPEAGFKFVRSFPLLKNAFGDPFVKSGNEADVVMGMRWACNGEHLVLVHRGKIRWFSLQTGIKVAKEHWLGDFDWVGQTFYDVDRNVFYSFGTEENGPY
jgi:hypothetical protein